MTQCPSATICLHTDLATLQPPRSSLGMEGVTGPDLQEKNI